MALSKDWSKHENQAGTLWVTNSSCSTPSAPHSSEKPAQQPGRAEDQPQVPAHHFVPIRTLFFRHSKKLQPMPNTVCSSAAHVGITGIVSYGIQITSTFLFVERQKRKHRSLRHGGILWPTTTGCKQLFDVYIMHGFKNKQVHSFIKRNTLNLK